MPVHPGTIQKDVNEAYRAKAGVDVIDLMVGRLDHGSTTENRPIEWKY